MADISKIRLPGSNQTYEIKDAVAREAIAGGVTFIIAWNGTSTPVVADIPAGVKVTYNEVEYTGTLSAETTGSGTHAQPGAFYLVKSSTQTTGGALDVYDEYVPVGTTGSKTWEKLGDTQIDLSDVVTGVTFTKVTDKVLGEDTTFTAGSSSVSFGAPTTDKVLGESTTFTAASSTVTLGTPTTDNVLGEATTFSTSVTPTTTYVKATASGAGTAWNNKDSVTAVTGYASPSTDTFVKSVSAETNKKMVTTSVPNVTAAGSASTWSFAMGSGDDSETLIISGGNSTAPTLGTAITVATGSTSTTGTGDAVVTGVTVGDSASAITALGTPSTDTVIGADSTFTITQPTIALATDSSSATGRVQVATGITSASTTAVTSGTGSDIVAAVKTLPSTGNTAAAQSITVGTNDKVTAITGMPTATAAAQSITVGTNDKVTVLTDQTSVTATKGNS